ncbi:MAG TPA: head maturation protease, ClpP-related [Candidatus Eisenbacteria bacterium]|nr:head maturation protease, ClpP-related [Candidatus Eisenbacteria bacterium]
MYRTQPGLRAVNLKKVRLFDRIGMHDPKLAQELRSLKLSWFKMRNQDGDGSGGGPDSGAAEIFIYDEIGGSFGVSVQDFIDELNEITADQIVVRINSPGGMLVDAIAISNALNQHPSTIITRVDGIAASAATLIAIAGDRLEMMPGSQLMVHDVLVDITGNAADLRDCIDWLNEQSMNIAQMYASKSGGTVDDWRALMLAETWMFAEESVTSGLADAIFVRDKHTVNTEPVADDQPMPDEEPDGDEPEEPGEQEPDESQNDDSEDDDDDAEDSIESEALAVLMQRKHRLTNRGFKYLGREKAPKPAISNKHDDFSDLVAAWR